MWRIACERKNLRRYTKPSSFFLWLTSAFTYNASLQLKLSHPRIKVALCLTSRNLVFSQLRSAESPSQPLNHCNFSASRSALSQRNHLLHQSLSSSLSPEEHPVKVIFSRSGKPKKKRRSRRLPIREPKERPKPKRISIPAPK